MKLEMCLLVGTFVGTVVFFATLPLWKPRYDYSRFEGAYRVEHRQGMVFVAFKSLAMLDWDMPDVGHKTDKCITITCRLDVVRIVEDWLNKNPGYSIILERTPGGVRGWLNKKLTVKEWTKVSTELNSDPMYCNLIKRLQVWTCRVCAKKRVGDYVSRPWMVLGNAPMELDLTKVYKEYRDMVDAVIIPNAMMVGLPGSGKSTYARELAESGAYYLISTDTCREELWGNEQVQGPWAEVWTRVLYHVAQAKAMGKPVIYDGCNLNASMREGIMSVVDGDWELAWCDVTPEVCLEQQKGRNRQVPIEVVYRFANIFEEPSLNEGFIRIQKV